MKNAVRAFPALAFAIEAAIRAVQGRGGQEALAEWQDMAERMFDANLGAAALEALCDLTRSWPPAVPAADLLMLGKTAIRAGRICGSAAARMFLSQWRQIWRRTGFQADIEGYCLGMERLAEAAPDAVFAVLERLPDIVQRASGETFFAWVYAGLRASGRDRRQRLAFFDLSSALSRQMLDRDRAGNDLRRLELRLRCGLLALWRERRQIGALERTPDKTQVPLRTSLAGGVLRFPTRFPGFSDGNATAIYRAAAAHAGAHYRYSTHRFTLGKLKPLQSALVSLIEDARVEALAIRQYPGLQALWLEFHRQTLKRAQPATAVGLMERLSRALLDSSYRDGDGWVAKGRRLFAAAGERLEDPLISREIGGLLGSDLGQMRLQFNIATYVVQPAYRDDNLALWDFGDRPDAPCDTIESEVDAIGIKTVAGVQAASEPDSGGRDGKTSPHIAAAADDIDETAIATCPEWDYALAAERPDWVTVRRKDPRAAALAAEKDLSSLTGKAIRIARGTPIGQRVRRRHLREGEIIHLDSAIEAMLALKMSRTPDERIFQRSTAGPRDLAALLLIDLSQSTADRDKDGRSVLSLEIEAASAIGTAMALAGDALAIDGFCSNGRENLYYTQFKSFAEPFDARVSSRLAGAGSNYSTRLGAALRHAASRLQRQRAFRRILILLTDGEPSDVDVSDDAYLREDARAALHGFRRKGIDAFALGVGANASTALSAIFGRKRTLHVSRAAVLPRRLIQLYNELKK